MCVPTGTVPKRDTRPIASLAHACVARGACPRYDLPMHVSFPDIIGHRSQRAYLGAAFAAGTLPHALLLAGPAHIGKTSVATRLAAHALGCTDPRVHPDFQYVERERDAKTGKLKGSVSIGQIRRVISRLTQTSFVGGWSVAIIDAADAIETPASNAMLKMLEEPGRNTLLILIAASDRDVIPTVRSRCDVIRFSRLPEEELRAALADRGCEQDRASRIAAISDGRPGLALSYLQDAAAFDAVLRFRADVARVIDAGLIERFSFVDKLLPPKLPFQESCDRAKDALDAICHLLRNALAADWGGAGDDVSAGVNGRLGRGGAARAMEEAVKLRGYVDANVAPRAVLERFMAFLPH